MDPVLVLLLLLLITTGTLCGLVAFNPESDLARGVGFVVVPPDKVGVVRRRLGGNPSDPRFRATPPGTRGVQARCLTPGTRYWFPPGVYSVTLEPRTDVPAGMIGLVTARDGAQRPADQPLGRRVECNNFQDGVAFLLDGGERGRQLATLPGDASYYINPALFQVDFVPRTHVPDGTVGLVIAKVGRLRPPDKPFGRHVECRSFQDGDAFLLGGGEQGRQLAVLGGGASYDIHPDLFDVVTIDTLNRGSARMDGLTPGHLRIISIPVGYVGVVVTLHGIKPPPGNEVIGPTVPDHSSFRLPWVFLNAMGWRGVQAQTLRQGEMYALNPWFVRVILMPTRLLTLEWKRKGSTEADNYDAELEQLVINIQGFPIRVNVTQILQIPASAAPRLVSHFGGEVTTHGLGGLVNDPRPVQRFVERVLGGTVENYLTEVASSTTVQEYYAGHDTIRAGLAARVRQSLAEWGVTVSDTLLGLSESENPGSDQFRRRVIEEQIKMRTMQEGMKGAQIQAQIKRVEIAVEREERGLTVAELERLAEVLGPEVPTLRALVREIKDMPVPQVIGSDTAALAALSPWQRIQEALSLIRSNQQPQDTRPDAGFSNKSSTAQSASERIHEALQRAEEGESPQLTVYQSLVHESENASLNPHAGDHVDHPPTPPATPAGVPDLEPVTPHRLIAELAEQAPPGREVPLQVQVTQGPGDAGVALRAFHVPVEGVRLIIAVHAPGLLALGDLQQELIVLPGRDSDVLRFGLKTMAPGLHTVTVRAFRGGSFLGELRAQISVQTSTPARDGPALSTPLTTLAFDPGEVTLQVLKGEGGAHSFQLFSETTYAPESFRLMAGDAHSSREQIYDELRRIAAAVEPGSGGDQDQARRRLRNLGVQLWASAVPDAVRRQFWEEADRISALTVLGEHDAVPWELLYPRDRDQEGKGFLAEWLPVVRRVFRQERVRELSLNSAAFVVPPGSPPEADREVAAVRTRLGSTAVDIGTITHRSVIAALIENGDAGLLHFACHNAFTSAGSHISMADGLFDPIDLAYAAQSGTLRATHPLVFLNACRSAGEIDWFATSLGWGPQFLRAGAGAFIGTLWPVRSDSALTFADTFYDFLVTHGQTLGEASLRARQAISAQGGDPTWLAYTVYGSPAARAART